MTLSELMEKYEVPEELHPAMFEAYELGALRFMQIQMGIELSQQIASSPEFKKEFQENANV